MTFLIDIDNTIQYAAKKQCKKCNRIQYETILVDEEEIKRINKLYNDGNTIIMWTGRNWDCYDITKKQLKELNVKYHELIMGKPQGIYIDKDAKTTLKEYT